MLTTLTLTLGLHVALWPACTSPRARLLLLSATGDPVELRESAASDREVALGQREQTVGLREQAVGLRERAVDKREEALRGREGGKRDEAREVASRAVAKIVGAREAQAAGHWGSPGL